MGVVIWTSTCSSMRSRSSALVRCTKRSSIAASGSSPLNSNSSVARATGRRTIEAPETLSRLCVCCWDC